ncbi:WD40/YVTN/BNR-like repeat-containing protein [Kineococcus sp. SYSU DK005]|uniref:WD40/YVTN/BNR-like repeat-containing protein n=1 Tax=Kineococcus sp. SYSU DK005 TaxID=3383126 RepID=UPI003D7DA68E
MKRFDEEVTSSRTPSAPGPTLGSTPGVRRRSLLAGSALTAAAASTAFAAPAAAGGPRYRWRNVEIVAGGFVPGIVFSRAERGLAYARTDIGGAYRLDRRSRRWVPLLDWVGWDRWGWSGVLSIAADPVDADRVYAAVGTYTNDWDPSPGAVLRSTDRGRSWEAFELPFKLGGNMPGRGMGERLAVDPNRHQNVYLGAPSGRGLWRSTDSGATFAPVESFPNPGPWAADPGDASGYSSDPQGVLWVTFDPRSGGGGRGRGRGGRRGRGERGGSSTFYVGVADPQNVLYRTTDGGRTFERVPGQPTGFLPHKGVLDEARGHLYLATSDTAGPYDGSRGDVWRLDTATGEWVNVSPVPSTSPDAAFGYSGLTVDRQRPGTLVVATQIQWSPDVVFFRSTDSGATWSRAWDLDADGRRRNRYEIDTSASPWLTFGQTPEPPEEPVKLGWMTESVEIDPFDPDHLLYGTGATLYGVEDLTNWDRDRTFHVSVHAEGIEETAILDLVSPAEGAHLVSAVGDLGGFVHHDLDRAPDLMFQRPYFTSGTGVDAAGLRPRVLARVGNPGAQQAAFGLSTDGGATWTPAATQPAGTTGGGNVAVGADGSRTVWAPAGAAVSWTRDGGATWAPSAGAPAGAAVEADRVDPAVFYAFAAGVFSRSDDGGATFTATGATGLPAAGAARFAAVPGLRGHVWLAGGQEGGTYGLWRSTDSGATFTRVAALEEADAVGFGRAAPGADHPVVFTSAQQRGVRGIYRSDDAGRTWVRVNDDRHQWAWTGAAITGDPRVHGRVYVATNGRGILRGDTR